MKVIDRTQPARTPFRPWTDALLYAILITTVILGLFYYWFAVANRYVIFLYAHLDATPFDDVTRSRYWMAGLVASGIVMVGWLVWNWFMGRWYALRRRRYIPPSWQHIWVLCWLPLSVGIPLITMYTNQPVLPFTLALFCVLVTMTGLSFALAQGETIAQHPAEFGWLTLYGLGLSPTVLLLRAVELPARGLVAPPPAYIIAGASVVGSWLYLLLLTHVRARCTTRINTVAQLMTAVICISYLFLPLLHYLAFVPPDYRYISTSSNFFAFSWLVQVVSWGLAILLAAWTVRRQRTVTLRRAVR